MDLAGRIDKLSNKIDSFATDAEVWHALFTESPLAAGAVDENFNIIAINEEFTSLTGWGLEIIDRPLSTVICPDDRKIHSVYVEAFKEAPRKRLGNMGLHPRLYTKKKRIIDVEVSISYTEVHGKFYFIFFVRPVASLIESLGDIIK